MPDYKRVNHVNFGDRNDDRLITLMNRFASRKKQAVKRAIRDLLLEVLPKRIARSASKCNTQM